MWGGRSGGGGKGDRCVECDGEGGEGIGVWVWVWVWVWVCRFEGEKGVVDQGE